MRKRISIVIFMVLGVLIFPMERDMNLKRAKELSWNKKYSEAKAIYKELLKEYSDIEIVLAYSDLLVWSGEYKESIDFLRENSFDEDIYYLQLGKIYFWNKNYSLARKTYMKTDKTDSTRESFENWYSNFNNYELKYKYSWEFVPLDREEIPGLYFTYNYYDKWSFVLSQEYFYKRVEEYDKDSVTRRSKLRNRVDLMEFYYKQLYLALGKADYWDRSFSIEYTYKFLTLGLKDIDNFTMYKLRTDNYYKDFIFTQEINIPEHGNKYYKTEIKYSRLTCNYFYDFNDLSRSEIKYEHNLAENMVLDFGFFKDHKAEKAGALVETAYKF